MTGTARRQDAGEARREHRNVWLDVLFVGLALIVLFNWIGWGPWWVALLLSALMVWFGWTIRDTEVSSDSKGESFYYVGLIFTFVALVAALVVFDGGSDANRTIGIIRNFGIALVTTIWGLTGRVWYAMSGDAPGDLEEAIRGDLEEAVSEMKGSLDRARHQLDILVDTFEVSGNTMVATVGKISDTADRAAQTTDRLDELANRVGGTAESLAENVSAFHGAVEGGAKAARSLRESLDETGELSASLGRELASAGSGFRAFTTVVAKAEKAAVPVARRIREASDGLASAASETASLRGAVSDLRRRAGEVDGAVERIGSDADEARGALGEVGTHARRAGRSARDLTSEAGVVHEELASIRESADKARRGIDDVAASAGSLNDQVDSIDGLALWESVGAARSRSDKLGSDLSGLRQQSAQVSQHLATAGQEATKTVRGNARGTDDDPGRAATQRGGSGESGACSPAGGTAAGIRTIGRPGCPLCRPRRRTTARG